MCNNYKNCVYAITDYVEEGIEILLFCSFHDCLPEDCPKDCNPNQECPAPPEHTFETYLCPHLQAWLRDGETEVCTLTDHPCVPNCDHIGYLIPIVDLGVDWTTAGSKDDLPF